MTGLARRDTARAFGARAADVDLGEVDPASGRMVLSASRTLPTAAAFVREHYDHPEGRRLYYHAERFLQWRGNRFVELEHDAIRAQLQPWLHAALRYVGRDLKDFNDCQSTVNGALDAVFNAVYLPDATTAPTWLDGRAGPDPREVLPCASMSLHIPTMTPLPPTPALFTTNALAFDYDASAPAPAKWLAFLRELWDDDEDSIRLLQECFGYYLTPDTSLQKALLLVGPMRSGKGTIGRVLRQLVGESNVCGPTTGSLAGDFGLQPLIGRSLAIVSDARFVGEHVATVTERLLCVTGEDPITINRKFKGAVTLKLPTRFVFLTNELPRMNDASTALARRFLVLTLQRSFYGQEDARLTEKLTAELPGILGWALAGWQRLHARGHFVQPTAGADALEELADLSSPVRPFIRECCVTGAAYRCPVDRLWSAWEMWCSVNGRAAGNKQLLGRDLAAAVPGVKRRRTSASGDAAGAFYEGLAVTSQTADALATFRKAGAGSDQRGTAK